MSDYQSATLLWPRSGSMTPPPEPPTEDAKCAARAGGFVLPASTGSLVYPVPLNGPVQGGLIWSTQSSVNGSQSDALMSLGAFAVNGNQACVGMARSDGGVANFSTNVYHDNTAAIIGIEEDPGFAQPAVLNIRGIVTPGTNEVSVNWTATKENQKVGFLAIGGTGVQCNVVEFVAITSGTNQTVPHGLPGTPTGAIVISAGAVNTPPGSNDSQFASLGIGFSNLTRNRNSSTYIAEGGSASYHGQIEAFVNHVHSFGTFTEIALISSWDSTNLYLNWSTVQLAEYYYVLVFRGLNADVGTFISPATPTATRTVTLTGEPTGFLVSSIHRPTTAIAEDGAWLSVGGSDGSRQCSASIVGDYSDSNALRSSHNSRIVSAVNTADTLYEEATASFSGNDVDVRFTDCDANEYNYMGFWCTPTPPTSETSQLLLQSLDPGLPTSVRYTNGTARIADTSRSGTDCQMPPGRCYQMNGLGDRVAFSGITFGADKSFTAWVKTAATSYSCITEIDSGEWTCGVNQGGSGEMSFFDGSSWHNATATGLNDDTWHHLAWVITGTTVEYFLDGVSKGTDTIASTTQSSVAGTLGRATSGLAGEIFDCRWFNRAIADAEVTTISAMALGSQEIGAVDTVIHYKCDEGGTYTTAIDSSGNGNDGTITAAAIATFHDESANDKYSFQSELGFRPVLALDGADDTIEVKAGSTVRHSFTWAAWVRIDSLAAVQKMFVHETAAGGAGSWDVYIDATSGEFEFITQGIKNYASGANVAIRTWTHLAIVFDASFDCEFFVNGSSVGKVTGTSQAAATGNSFWIGSAVGASDFFVGQMRDVRFWESILTPANIASVYAGGVVGSPLVSLPFAGDLLDVSGNNNHGTKIGATTAELFATATPRDESDTDNDVVFGLALPCVGPISHDPILLSPCGTFNGTNNQITGTPSVPAYPYTLAAHFFVPSGGGESMVFLNDANDSTHYIGLWLTTGGQVQVIRRGGGSQVNTNVGSVVAADTWHSLVVEFVSATAFSAWLNGVKTEFTGLTAVTPTGLDRLVAGLYNLSVPSNYWNGRLANVQFSADVSDAEAEAFPTAPASIISDWPICENGGTTIYDRTSNNNDGTVNGTLSAFWDNQQNVSDTLITDGYRRAGSINIPAQLTGGVAADGNALTHGPGVLAPGQSLDLTGGEANSVFAQQVSDAGVTMIYAQGDDDDSNILFARVETAGATTGGDDRILIYLPALTGDDLANVQAYTA